jgi:mRNA-degrading endonuclease toxin of MazEF toxin-antitoxin module
LHGEEGQTNGHKKILGDRTLLGAVLVLGGAGDASAHHTYFTFTHPVEIPGNVTLPPGTYEFRTIQTTTTRRLVEVRDASTEKVYATLLAVPAEHSGRSENSQLSIRGGSRHSDAGGVVLVDGGRRVGHEFVYPREQTLRLSRTARTSLAMSASPMSTTTELRSARVMRTEVNHEPVATSGTAPADVRGEVGPHQESRRP